MMREKAGTCNCRYPRYTPRSFAAAGEARRAWRPWAGVRGGRAQGIPSRASPVVGTPATPSQQQKCAPTHPASLHHLAAPQV
eukprot:scaffold58089_cov18-Phaeocystis_antarctica.AAC.1